VISNKEQMWGRSVGRNSKEQLAGLPTCRSGNKYKYKEKWKKWDRHLFNYKK